LLEAFDPRFLGEFLRRFENALLDQMRFNVRIHAITSLLISRALLQGKAPLAIS
jgi:hypothetical protein